MKKIWSKKIIISTAVIALFYVIATIYLMNINLVRDTVWGTYPLSYKWNLLIALMAGMWTAMSHLSLVFLVMLAVLTGANLTLTVQRLRTLRSTGRIHFAVGGSSLLGIIGSGCASCGLPILALLGLSGSAFYLPFRGLELSVIAIMLLLFSLYIIIKSNKESETCNIS